MGSNALIKKLCFMYYLSWLLPVLFFSRSAGQDVPFKAVNLGGWLVAEGGMTPFLFDGITNKDLLDGTHVSLRSTKLNNFLAAENGGGAGLVADTTTISGWETFREIQFESDGRPSWSFKITKRYAYRSSFVAIALMNEPSAASITLDTLTKYYKAGYDAVRRHSFSAYVILSNRLGNADNRELLPLGGTLPRSVIEVHYYNLFWDYFNTLTVQGNIDYVNNERAQKLREVTQINGPLSFVGEWTITNATMEDYQRFEKAQLNLYGRATFFGWAYWSYKSVADHWNLKWMIENNYINLKS